MRRPLDLRCPHADRSVARAGEHRDSAEHSQRGGRGEMCSREVLRILGARHVDRVEPTSVCRSEARVWADASLSAARGSSWFGVDVPRYQLCRTVDQHSWAMRPGRLSEERLRNVVLVFALPPRAEGPAPGTRRLHNGEAGGPGVHGGLEPSVHHGKAATADELSGKMRVWSSRLPGSSDLCGPWSKRQPTRAGAR
jgi:hypothetical protein